jgi:AMMECR1 domain-containing protein
MNNGLPKKSKREKVSGIKENRREEREIMRRESIATEMDVPSATITPQVTIHSDDDISPRLRMIRAKAGLQND